MLLGFFKHKCTRYLKQTEGNPNAHNYDILKIYTKINLLETDTVRCIILKYILQNRF